MTKGDRSRKLLLPSFDVARIATMREDNDEMVKLDLIILRRTDLKSPPGKQAIRSAILMGIVQRPDSSRQSLVRNFTRFE